MSTQLTTEEMPEATNGFVQTLNKMGYMTCFTDEFSEEFTTFAAEFCSAEKGTVSALEIGAAYGIATLKALEKGAKIISNDMEARHLEILKNRAPESLRPNLSLKPGTFPNGLDFEDDGLGAVLICRVMHFFDGPTMETSAAKLFKWLKSGGKIFIVTETPYLNNWGSFIPIYEQRKNEGHLWPGFIEDVGAVAPPERASVLPRQMQFFDPDILTRIFGQVGFVVEKCEMFGRPEFPEDLRLDGRESVGLIARKP